MSREGTQQHKSMNDLLEKLRDAVLTAKAPSPNIESVVKVEAVLKLCSDSCIILSISLFMLLFILYFFFLVQRAPHLEMSSLKEFKIYYYLLALQASSRFSNLKV
jgi:hypothetical protein